MTSVDKTIGRSLRRLGDNQGFYLGMNMVPLYSFTEESDTEDSKTKIIERIKNNPEELTAELIENLRKWSSEENNNWRGKFKGKYKISMGDRAKELCSLLPDYWPLQILRRQTDFFTQISQMMALN